jgi:uncharacterized phage protein gp47/JayE
MRSDTCGCCEPSVKPTLVEIQNRPGLSAIAYRVGTFASFRQAMIQAMAEAPELDGLRTRESDDYAITILELWAAVADILTFYQERIASEAFLRTASYRDSVMRLARLLDYQLRPGVAATACLAFTVEKGKKVRIPVGLRIQSVPGQDEKPQKFETLEEITADARWNRLRILPAPIEINPLKKGRSSAFLTPGSEGLAIANTLSPGNNIILFNDGKNNPVEILEVKEVCTEGDQIILSWSKPIQGEEWTSKTVVYKAVRQFRLFGYNVPETYMKAEKDPGTGRIIAWKEVPINNNLLKYPKEPKKQKITTSGTPEETKEYLLLDARYDDLKAGSPLLISDGGGSKVQVIVQAVEQGHDTLGPLSDTVTKVKISTPLSATIADRRQVIIYELEGQQIRFWEYEYPDEIDMQNPHVYITIIGSNIDGETIEIGQTIEAGTYVPGVKIGLKEIEKGRKVLLVDELQTPVSATITSSLLTTNATYGNQSYLMLNLEPASKIRLKKRSAALLGNIALVSHGETVKPEVVGDGDASAKYQRFSLKKKPVTFVPSAGPGGVKNTLNVLVNNMLWREAPSLFGRGATDQVYITKVDDDGTTSIQFGDGATGARLPSGRGNIIAKYRQESGLSGRVRANTITTLLDRPAGLKSATNPAPAEGGADQENLDQARINAPMTVRTFGRAVSLRDFEDLATTSGGVAKARATWVWSGWKRAVHLTVAGQQGSTFSADALARIHASLTTRRDPNHVLFLDNYRPVPVVVTTKLGVADGHVAEEVEKEARTALLHALSFEKLEFGMPLHLSEVFAILQGVNGAAWVDVDLFHFKDRSQMNLAGRGADPNPVQEHLRIYPARINPTSPFIVLPAEQACIEVPTVDIQIMTSGGLP